MEPGALLRNARLEAGLTQAELAGRAGTTQAAIARVETGRTNPTVKTLEKLIAAAGRRLELSAPPAPSSVDETLIASQLRLSPAQRLHSFQVSYDNVRTFVNAARRARGDLA